MSDNTDTGAATSAADLLADTSTTTTTPTGGDTTTGGSSTTASTAATDTLSGGQGSDWLDSLDDADLKGWAKNKGFPSVKDALASARNLETLLGREKLPLPKDENDKEGWDRLYKAAGRPNEPAAYALDKIEGADPEFAGAAATKFHELGLSAKQAQGLAKFWQDSSAGAVEGLEQQFRDTSRAEMADWLKEASTQAPALTEQARRAMRAYGLDKDAVSGMERAMGTRKFMDFMSKVGGSLNEDSFEGDGGKGGFGLSVEQARSRLDSLMKDREYAKAYIGGDATKRAEVERLNRILAGETV